MNDILDSIASTIANSENPNGVRGFVNTDSVYNAPRKSLSVRPVE